MMNDLYSEDIPVDIPTEEVSTFVQCLRAEVQQNLGWAITGRRDEQELTAHLYFHRMDAIPFTLHVSWRFQEGLTAVTVLVGQAEEMQVAVDLAALGPGQLEEAVASARQLIEAARNRYQTAELKEYDITCPLLTDHVGRVQGRHRFGPFVLIPEDPKKVLGIGPEGRLLFQVRAIDEEHAREVAHAKAVIGAAFLAMTTRTCVIMRRGPGRGVSSQPVPHKPGTLDALWNQFPDGITVNVQRPHLEPLTTQGWLRVPQDIAELYERYANLPREKKVAFTNAMLAYQTALDLRGTYHTLTAVGFVAALNTIAPRVESVRQCPDCARQERALSHRLSIRQLIIDHVPLDEAGERRMMQFIDRIYGGVRSGYVHAGELRGRELIGSYWGTRFIPDIEGLVPQSERFSEDIRTLESITNAILVSWLLQAGA